MSERATKPIYQLNWQVIHELLLAELKRLEDGTSVYSDPPAQPGWWKDEFTRMNNIAVEKAMRREDD